MSLRRALVDRARRVYAREDPDSTWREGQPEGAEAYGPWFAVRFTLGAGNEIEVPERGGYSYVDDQAGLLIGTVYADGRALSGSDGFAAFDADDMLEIDSEVGTGRWFVDGAASPLRRRRGVIGFTVRLRRAREPQGATGTLSSVDAGAVPDTNQPTDVPPDIQITIGGSEIDQPADWWESG